MTGTGDFDAAMADARRAAGGPVDGFVERLAERIGAKASVTVVFGEPIERDGITVITVAKVRWGFGGGAGSGRMAGGPDGVQSGSGEGGGGGVSAEPVGWIEIGPDGAEFKAIVPAMPSPSFFLAVGVTAALVLRSIARLLRG